jgi:hypothetical protein
VVVKPIRGERRQARRAAWGIEMAVLALSALGVLAFALYAARIW